MDTENRPVEVIVDAACKQIEVGMQMMLEAARLGLDAQWDPWSMKTMREKGYEVVMAGAEILLSVSLPKVVGPDGR